MERGASDERMQAEEGEEQGGVANDKPTPILMVKTKNVIHEAFER